MYIKRTLRSRISLVLVLAFVLSLFLPAVPVVSAELVAVAEDGGNEIDNETQTIGDLEIGDRVVDNSWEWEHRLGNNYAGTGPTKPVTWIVVAKDHYGVGSGVTLLSEKIIARHTFDNSFDRGSNDGSNHWGDSGSTNATRGLRKFLNGSSYDYAGGYEGEYGGASTAHGDGNDYAINFFDAFSDDFKDAVLTTAVTCIENDGTEETNPYNYEEYITLDKVFLPSWVELNGGTGDKHSAEAVWPYFRGVGNFGRIALEANGGIWRCWTRTPYANTAHSPRYTEIGPFIWPFARNSLGVRPALNLSPNIPVSGIPNADGVYEINGASFLEFKFKDSDNHLINKTITAEICMRSNVIRAVLPEGTDVTNLVPAFNLSPGATAKIGDVVQKSGVTVNDFSEPVTYVITSQHDGVMNKEWIVHVVCPLDNQIPIKFLPVGARVVDNSWEWEHRSGPDYSGEGPTKPVTWIVVAKDHYGAGSGVTLLTEEIIARHSFDNSTDRGGGDSKRGSNHWGDSGSTDATHGLRKFLNGSSYDHTNGYGGTYSGAPAATGDGNEYGVTFFDSFSPDFQDAVLTTAVLCRANDRFDSPYNGEEYITLDKVFLPSMFELGGFFAKHSEEVVWPYFKSAVNVDRIALEANGLAWQYWTRSHIAGYHDSVCYVDSRGIIEYYNIHNRLLAVSADGGVRPALNLSPDILVSVIPNADGVYEISGSNFLDFKFKDPDNPSLDETITAEICMRSNVIRAVMPVGTDVTNLVPAFNLSPGATAKNRGCSPGKRCYCK